MRTFIITISTNPDSVRSANTARETAKQVGYEAEIEHFEAVTPANSNWRDIIPDDNNCFFWYMRPENVACCFASHFLLWKKCIELNEPILILEHDATFEANIPDDDFNMCVNYGKPTYMKEEGVTYEIPVEYEVAPLRDMFFFGHHAYAIKPEAAKIFVEDTLNDSPDTVLLPNDVWIHKAKYPWLEEYYPGPVIADTEYSTVQAKPMEIKDVADPDSIFAPQNENFNGDANMHPNILEHNKTEGGSEIVIEKGKNINYMHLYADDPLVKALKAELPAGAALDFFLDCNPMYIKYLKAYYPHILEGPQSYKYCRAEDGKVLYENPMWKWGEDLEENMV